MCFSRRRSSNRWTCRTRRSTFRPKSSPGSPPTTARSTGGLKVIDAPAKSQYAKKVTFFSGGGGLVGTARDYMRFLTMIQNGGELDGHRILRSETVELMTTNQLPKEAFPIHFDKENRQGTGFGFGFSVRTREHAVGTGRPGRRIWLGRRRLDPLLGQPGRQIDRDHARTDHALSMGYRVRREKDHLRRDQQVRCRRAPRPVSQRGRSPPGTFGDATP